MPLGKQAIMTDSNWTDFRASEPRLQTPVEMALLAAPFIIYLYPAVAFLTAKSQIPIFFGMYSNNLLLLNALTIAVYGAFLFGLLAKRRFIQFGAILLLAILTLIATNTSVRDLPGILSATQVTRIAAGLALMVIVFLTDKEGGALAEPGLASPSVRSFL